MNALLERLARARRPVWVEGPAGLGAALARALNGTLIDARDVPERTLVETLRAVKDASRPVVLGLADAPQPGPMAVIFSLLHGQLHHEGVTETWSRDAALWIVAPRSGLVLDVAARLRLAVRAEALGALDAASPAISRSAPRPRGR
jgi:hypothetical protein